MGWIPSRLAVSSAIMMSAEPPSLRLEEFPAVTVPPGLNAGRKARSDSILISDWGCSSVSKRDVPCRPFTATGTISSLKWPFSIRTAGALVTHQGECILFPHG